MQNTTRAADSPRSARRAVTRGNAPKSDGGMWGLRTPQQEIRGRETAGHSGSTQNRRRTGRKKGGRRHGTATEAAPCIRVMARRCGCARRRPLPNPLQVTPGINAVIRAIEHILDAGVWVFCAGSRGLPPDQCRVRPLLRRITGITAADHRNNQEIEPSRSPRLPPPRTVP